MSPSFQAHFLNCAGTAVGNLGQHTEFRKDPEYGLLPVFDHRLKVFEQVSQCSSSRVAAMLKKWTDAFRNATHIDPDHWVHEAVCAAFL